MKRAEIGKAWVIHSEDTLGERYLDLISIQSPRKSIQNIASYVEHVYVDRFASIEEKIAYKKKTSSWPYPAEILRPACVVCCGFGPVYFAHFCHHVSIEGELMIGKYRFVKSLNENHEPVEFTDGQVTIKIA